MIGWPVRRSGRWSVSQSIGPIPMVSHLFCHTQFLCYSVHQSVHPLVFPLTLSSVFPSVCTSETVFLSVFFVCPVALASFRYGITLRRPSCKPDYAAAAAEMRQPSCCYDLDDQDSGNAAEMLQPSGEKAAKEQWKQDDNSYGTGRTPTMSMPIRPYLI